MTRLLVDGIFFQINSTGIARVWRTLLGMLAEEEGLEIYFLDRGGAPDIAGIEKIPFAPYDVIKGSAADSAAIQDVCDQLAIDVFTSTYYTTPLSTPMLLMVYDMIPELFDYELRDRMWMEKQLAISFAQRYLCISEKTRSDLLTLYPEIPSTQTVTAYCGVDVNTFRQRSEEEITAFRDANGLTRDYFLFVGTRGVQGNYKNSWLFFKALQGMKETDFDVFCVGGEPEIQPEIKSILPPGVRCSRTVLSDDELAIAYGGATALVYPSLYEGFGMPVIEAMASGCPVITTNHGSLAEAAGDAALLIEGQRVSEMREALTRVRNKGCQTTLRAKGFEHARSFSWTNMANRLKESVEALAIEAGDNRYEAFFDNWRVLRTAQAGYDIVDQE